MSESTAVATERRMSPEQAFRSQISSPAGKAQFEAALPAHVPVDRFIRMTMTVINQQPNLLKCDRLSLQTSLITAASLGLMPETFLGEAYFIPRGDKVTLQIGYKGLLKLARNTGEISSIESGVIHENDEYQYIEGDTGEFWVRPNLMADRGKPIAVWCVIKLKSGESQREIMSALDVERIRQGSQSANSPAWKAHWAAMARKVVIKRALKYAPSSTELLKAVAIDDANDPWVVEPAPSMPPPPPALEHKQPEPEPEPEPVRQQAAPKREKKASPKALDALEQHLNSHVEPEPPEPTFHEQYHEEEDGQLVDGDGYGDGLDG